MLVSQASLSALRKGLPNLLGHDHHRLAPGSYFLRFAQLATHRKFDDISSQIIIARMVFFFFINCEVKFPFHHRLPSLLLQRFPRLISLLQVNSVPRPSYCSYIYVYTHYNNVDMATNLLPTPDNLSERHTIDEVSSLSSLSSTIDVPVEVLHRIRRPSCTEISQQHPLSLPNEHTAAPCTQRKPGREEGEFQESLKLPADFRQRQRWKPAYLDRRFLFVSIILCSAVIIVIEVLVSYSTSHQGLAESYNGLHYLWTYGPTILLTVSGAIWARIDHQVKMMAPWDRLAQGKPASAKQTLLLDYVSPMPPLVLLRAIQQRDFQVAASLSITLLWSVLIAFSASLISLTPTEIHVTVPATLLTSLRDSKDALLSTNTLPFDDMLGLAQNTFPDGVSEEYAYQKFTGPTIPFNTELRTTVDAISTSLECQAADLHFEVSASPVWINPTSNDLYPELQFNYTMSSANCTVFSSGFIPDRAYYQGQSPGEIYISRFGENPGEVYFSRFGLVNCQNSPDTNDTRVAVLLGYLRYNANDPGEIKDNISANMSQSTQLLCRPLHNVSSITISKNGTAVQSFSKASSLNVRALTNVSVWDIANAQISSMQYRLLMGWYGDTNYTQKMKENMMVVEASDVPIDVDLYMYLVLGQFSQAPLSFSSLLNPHLLENAVYTIYQKFAALVVHENLMEPASIQSTGSAFLYQDRLFVNNTAGHVMSAILAIVIVLLGVIILKRPKRNNFLSDTPSSISGTANLMRYSQAILHKMQNIGQADFNTIRAKLNGTNDQMKIQNCNVEVLASHDAKPHQTEAGKRLNNAPASHPVSLCFWCRVGISLKIVGIIAILEYLLQRSQSNNGLADNATDSSYIHYSWTTVPALLFAIIGLIYSSTDFNIRMLTPYAHLSRDRSFSRTIGLDLLNLGVPRMLFRELRTKSFAALTGTLAALIASMLATFSSSLFVSSNIPTTEVVRLRTFGSLHNNTSANLDSQADGFSGVVVLHDNLTYPAFTYEDLVFPELSINFDSLENQKNHSLTVNATVSAIRSKMDCQLYNMSNIRADIFDGHVVVDAFNTSGPTPERLRLGIFTLDIPVPSDFVMASAGLSPPYSRWYCDVMYLWYSLTPGTDPTVSSVAALICNETLDVDVTFRNAGLEIDPTNPPRPLEDTARSTSAGFGADSSYSLYNTLPIRERARGLDGFFDMLTSSRYAIAVSDLRDPRRMQVVRDAIIRQHGIIRAQQLNDVNRVPAANYTAFLPRGSTAASDADITYAATMTDMTGRSRVVQDPTATRTLEALLAMALVCSLAAWALMPRTRILAADPTNIASVMALLVDGNFYNLLPPHEITSGELEQVFKGLTFRLAWGNTVMPGEEENKEPRFGIFGTV